MKTDTKLYLLGKFEIKCFDELFIRNYGNYNLLNMQKYV